MSLALNVSHVKAKYFPIEFGNLFKTYDSPPWGMKLFSKELKDPYVFGLT